MTYVTTKNELQEAVKRGDSDIIVRGKLAKKLRGFAKLKKLSPKEIAAVITFLTGAGVAAATAIALAAPTGGLSVAGATVSFIAAAPAAGVSASTAVTIVIILGVIGVTTFALIKDYNIELDVDGEGIHFKAKQSANESP